MGRGFFGNKVVHLLTCWMIVSGALLTAGGQKDNGELAIGLAVPNLQADFFSQIKDSVLAQAKAEGVTVIVVDAKNDGATQVNQVQDLITRNIDALIYIPAGATAASVPVKLSKQAGIPVICVDRFPPDMRGDTFIASDSVASARELGKWVIEQVGGKAKIAVLHGQMGTTPEVDRTKGWRQAMSQSPGMVTVAEQSADWDTAKAFTVAQDMLQKNPDINVFFGQSDSMALGAARAVKLANLGHDVIVVGFDGDVAALKELKSGTFNATATQQTRKMGKMAYQAVKDALAGKKLPQDQLLVATLTTKDNVDQFIANHP